MKNHGSYTSPQVYARIAGVLLITSFMAGVFGYKWCQYHEVERESPRIEDLA